jgi:hypothetical protein
MEKRSPWPIEDKDILHACLGIDTLERGVIFHVADIIIHLEQEDQFYLFKSAQGWRSNQAQPMTRRVYTLSVVSSI